MHELGVVTEVVALAAARSQGAPIRRLVLEIGKLSTVLPDAVRFCFDLATEDTVLAGAELTIVECDGLAKCRKCGAEVTLERALGECACGSMELEWISGMDVRILSLELDVMDEPRRIASDTREWLRAREITMVNLMSSPGAGKTTILELTAKAFGTELPLFVIEGDQATSLDADRVRAAGARAVQIETGTGCHLEAAQVRRALEELAPPRGACVLVENVGNLVCPAQFDLGESERVVVLSTTEGDDKPLKYPHIFQTATLVVLNKLDLLAHVSFALDRFESAVRVTSPRAHVVYVSANPRNGARDLAPWLDWLRERSGHASTPALHEEAAP